MPWESVGECGLPSTSEEWEEAQVDMAVAYIRASCGDPPSGCDLGAYWKDHGGRAHACVGLHWEPGRSSLPWPYLKKAGAALSHFNAHMDWKALDPERRDPKPAAGRQPKG